MDFFTTSVAFFIFNLVRFHLLEESTTFSTWQNYVLSTKIVAEQILIPLVLLGTYWLSGYYNYPLSRSRALELITTFLTAIFNAILIFFLLIANDTVEFASTNYMLVTSLCFLLFIFTYTGRLAITTWTIKYNKTHPQPFSTIVVGNSHGCVRLLKSLGTSRAKYQYNIIGFVPIPGEEDVNETGPTFPFSALEETCRSHEVTQVLIAPNAHNDVLIMQVLDKLSPLDISVKISPDTLSFVTSNIKLHDIFGEPLVDLTSPPLSAFALNLKTAIDKLSSALLLMLLSPLFLGIAIAVKCSTRGPVFYSQERMGFRRKPFRIYKFRTMVPEAESNGPALSSETDSRVTPIGAVLRKYRLDELPQFWNVLKGDMSLVGPRPEREYYINKIIKFAPYYRLVFQVRPGITSWGMVKYGYASSVEQMVERTKFDLIYINNMSLALDLKIVIYTFRTVFMGAGM